MGFGGFLPSGETGGTGAVPEPGDTAEQLHPVPAEGGCSAPDASPSRDPSQALRPWGVLFPPLLAKSCPSAGAWWEKCDCFGEKMW